MVLFHVWQLIKFPAKNEADYKRDMFGNRKKPLLLRNDNNDGMPDKQYESKRIKKHSSSFFRFFSHLISFTYSLMPLCEACVVRKHVSTVHKQVDIQLEYKEEAELEWVKKNDFVTCFVQIF